MKDIRIQGKLRKNEILIFLALIGGAYAAGTVFSVVLGRSDAFAADEKGAAFGWMFAAIMFVIVYGMGMVFSFMQDFNVAIGMGRTRRDFLTGWIAVTVAELAVCAAFYELLGFAEKAIVAWAAPEMELALSMPDAVQWYHLAGAAVILLVWVLFGSALVLKVGTRMLWVFWAVFVLLCIVPVNLAENEKVRQYLDSTGILSGGVFTAKGIAAAGLILCTVLLFAALRMLGRQRVTA